VTMSCGRGDEGRRDVMPRRGDGPPRLRMGLVYVGSTLLGYLIWAFVTNEMTRK
jgi:hypothetical protein